VSQPASIRAVVGVLQAGVLLGGERIDQMDLKSCIHQAVHQPIPVEGRFHRESGNLLADRLELAQDDLQPVWESLAEDYLVLLVGDGDEAVR
jgi:hypothetical protein